MLFTAGNYRSASQIATFKHEMNRERRKAHLYGDIFSISNPFSYWRELEAYSHRYFSIDTILVSAYGAQVFANFLCQTDQCPIIKAVNTHRPPLSDGLEECRASVKKRIRARRGTPP